MTRISLAIFFVTIIFPGAAQADERATDYASCMAFARESPERALDAARRWIEEGGEGPARHCEAIALLGALRYGDAALALQALAEQMTEAPVEDRADLLEQAAQAWLLSGNPTRAIEALSAALDLRPAEIEYLIGRAIARASAAAYWEAVDDLNRALELAPERVDALVMRAAAYRYLDSPELAAADAGRALQIDPTNAEAHMERGNIRRLAGDAAGARADWRRVIELAPHSPAAAFARANLARLDAAPD